MSLLAVLTVPHSQPHVFDSRLDLAKSTGYMGQRRLLREGTLCKHKSGRKLRAFLCNDMIVLTDEAVSRLYKMPIQLNQVEAKELPGKGLFSSLHSLPPAFASSC